MKRNFQDELGWDESPLRCLHTCFLPRSTRDAAGAEMAFRENIMEMYCGGIGGALRRFANRLLRRQDSRWKKDFYRRGPVQTVDARPFFS